MQPNVNWTNKHSQTCSFGSLALCLIIGLNLNLFLILLDQHIFIALEN